MKIDILHSFHMIRKYAIDIARKLGFDVCNHRWVYSSFYSEGKYLHECTHCRQKKYFRKVKHTINYGNPK